MYVPNNTVSKYVVQQLIKLHERIDESTNMLRDFNTPLLIIVDPVGTKLIKI